MSNWQFRVLFISPRSELAIAMAIGITVDHWIITCYIIIIIIIINNNIIIINNNNIIFT
jgi:hypothetical protein